MSVVEILAWNTNSQVGKKRGMMSKAKKIAEIYGELLQSWVKEEEDNFLVHSNRLMQEIPMFH